LKSGFERVPESLLIQRQKCLFHIDYFRRFYPTGMETIF